jgi:hypothetical protein
MLATIQFGILCLLLPKKTTIKILLVCMGVKLDTLH